MASPQAQPIHWSEDKYKELEGQLEGFWAQDEWDMFKCPLEKTTLGKLLFDLELLPLKTELKYACWRQFSTETWSISAPVISGIRHILKWLSTIDGKDFSILHNSLDKWETLFRSYLVNQGKRPEYTYQIPSVPTLRLGRQPSLKISLFRQIYKVVQEAYDDREEFEKDVWDIRKLGILPDASRSEYKVSFTKIAQLWFRQAAKQFMRYRLSTKAVGTCKGSLRALDSFSAFLSERYPLIKPTDINRQLIVEYLGYLLSKKKNKDVRILDIVYLRTFLELCAREAWLDITKEQIIYDDDIPKRTAKQPRYIPEEVLNQLNQNLDALPAYIMRMVLVIQETGRRISELCTMPFNCLMQDVQGDWFLRYKNSKMKRERSIPISKEIAAVILEQQDVVREEWGKDFPYLFPTPKPWGKGKPVRQDSFGKAINKLACQNNICDVTGKIWRFQSHQFRHTVGTKMANIGVPVHIIKTYLDHDSFEMTMRYVAIHDRTLKEEFVKFKDRMVDVTGKVVSYESVAAEIAEGSDPNSIDAQWLKKNIRAQALPNGLCALPVNQPECPYGANKCVAGPDGKGCPHFKTDIRYYDKHKEHLARTNEIVEWAQENPDSRRSQEVLKLNLSVKQNLERIITALESQSLQQ